MARRFGREKAKADKEKYLKKRQQDKHKHMQVVRVEMLPRMPCWFGRVDGFGLDS